MIDYRFDGDSWLLDCPGRRGARPAGRLPGVQPGRLGDRGLTRGHPDRGDQDAAGRRLQAAGPPELGDAGVHAGRAAAATRPGLRAPTRSLPTRTSRPAGSVGANKQRIQWLVGQPGGLIVELEEHDTVYAINVVQSNCIGNEVACPAKAPFKLTLGGYGTQPNGQWLPLSLVVWPGKSGDTLGTNVRAPARRRRRVGDVRTRPGARARPTAASCCSARAAEAATPRSASRAVTPRRSACRSTTCGCTATP